MTNPSFSDLFGTDSYDPENKIDLANHTIYGARVEGANVIKVKSISMQNLYNEEYRKIEFTVDSSSCGMGFFGNDTNIILENYNYSYGPVKYTIDLENKLASVEESYNHSSKTNINFSSYNLSNLYIGEEDVQATNCNQIWNFNF